LAEPLADLSILAYSREDFISKELNMDYKELSLLVAEKLGGDFPDEVKKELRLGKAKGLGRDDEVDADTVREFIVQTSQLATKPGQPKKTPKELRAYLLAKTETAVAKLLVMFASAFTTELAHKIIEIIVQAMAGSD
jgi:hypothetical protein